MMDRPILADRFGLKRNKSERLKYLMQIHAAVNADGWRRWIDRLFVAVVCFLRHSEKENTRDADQRLAINLPLVVHPHGSATVT